MSLEKTLDLQALKQLVIAGWTGRNVEALEAHIRELEAIGVKRPKSTPIFYRAAVSLLTTAEQIEVVGPHSSGEVDVLREVESKLEGRDVVIVDDIFDSGRTLAFAKALVEARGARSVRTCVLLDKQVPRAAAIAPDFTGFRCPPVFVVGYGMDLAHRYRELPFIGQVTDR